MPDRISPHLAAYTSAAHALADRYVIEREIGAGATATVFVALDIKHSRRVAIKVLRPELSSALNTQRFLREIEIAAGLTHPHILPIHDSGEADGLLYYVMPYVEGETLAARMTRERQMSIADTARIAREVCSALQFAHERGVVHRDIKPENILLSGGVAVVADFGLARALASDSGGGRLTETGIGLGTPHYMSPEQAVGEREIDGRADQYSFACVVHEMLAGEPPFEGDSFQRLLAQHVMEPPRSLRASRADLPASMEAALSRALEKTPGKRFATIGEFADALDPLATTSSGSRPNRSSSWTIVISHRGRRRAIAILGVAVAAVVAATAIALRVRPGARSAKLDANQMAVIPFDVFVPALAMWREGLMDILARDFDGAGPLRSVAPSVIMRLFSGRADSKTATDVARAAHAGLAVYGQLTQSGLDSATARVTIVNVTNDSTLGEIEVRDESARMDRLADSIAIRVLRELGRQRTIAIGSVSFFGSRSLPALKAFLQGEQLYRRNDYKAASPLFEQAIAFDSGFALAFRRMRGVYRAVKTETDSQTRAYAALAGAANHGLGPRDSLLILADSLASTLRRTDGYFTEIDGERSQRRIALLERAAQLYPNDPEVWSEVGEARLHVGERAGKDDRDALNAFAHALASDSMYGPAFYHDIELTLRLHGVDAAVPLIARYGRLNPSDGRFRLVSDILGRPKASRGQAKAVAMKWNDSLEAGAAITRAVNAQDGAAKIFAALANTAPTTNNAALARSFQGYLAIYRGRATEGLGLIDAAAAAQSPSGAALFGWLATTGALDRARASEVFSSWVRDRNSRFIASAMATWFAWSDTASIRGAIAVADSVLAQRSNPDSLAARHAGQVGRALLTLAARDTATAIARLKQADGPRIPWTAMPVRILTAQLLEARRDFPGAAAVLDARPPAESLSPWEIEWKLERARVADHMGDRVLANSYYSFVAGAWAGADSRLAEKVAEARRGAGQAK